MLQKTKIGDDPKGSTESTKFKGADDATSAREKATEALRRMQELEADRSRGGWGRCSC